MYTIRDMFLGPVVPTLFGVRFESCGRLSRVRLSDGKFRRIFHTRISVFPRRYEQSVSRRRLMFAVSVAILKRRRFELIGRQSIRSLISNIHELFMAFRPRHVVTMSLPTV